MKVEWKKLGEICEIRGRIGFRGYTRADQVEKGKGALSLSPGNIMEGCLDYENTTFISWEKYEESPEIIVEQGDIIFCKTASVGKVAYIENLLYKSTINPQLVLFKKVSILPKFLYYILLSDEIQNSVKATAGVGSVPNISQTSLAKLNIPIPLADKQKTIVNQLDAFTSLIASLESELDLRKKQFEHYRNQLLDFEGIEGVEWKKLADIMQVLRGSRLTKKDLSDDAPFPVYHGGLQPIGFYTQSNRSSKSVMIINVGASAGTIGFCNGDFWSSDGCFCLSHNEDYDAKFIYYYLKSQEHLITNKIRKAGIPTLDSIVVEKIMLPYKLPLSTQQSIVEKLDAFEQLVAKLEEEIALRKKQYEYYREKLLTFE